MDKVQWAAINCWSPGHSQGPRKQVKKRSEARWPKAELDLRQSRGT